MGRSSTIYNNNSISTPGFSRKQIVMRLEKPVSCSLRGDPSGAAQMKHGVEGAYISYSQNKYFMLH
jgi:hypothetical protein